MAKNDEARRRADSEHAERLAALFSGGALTTGQDDLLSDILLELSNNTGVCVYSPEVVAAFYVAAARRKGAARQRNELMEALRLIETGERFDDYIGNDGVRRWKLRRRARANSTERSIAGNLVRVLASTKTPVDYRAALCEALSAYAKVAFTEYDESDPRETYLAAAGEYAIWPDRPGFHEARLRIVKLLYGLRKKRPLDAIAPPVTAPPAVTPPEASKRIGELRRKLDGLYEPENEAARFKVEREIYDLTHAPADAEEWSEFVGC